MELSAVTIRHQVSGHIIAFVTEREHNDDKIKLMVTSHILAQQFDMIAYLANEQYSVSIGDGEVFYKQFVYYLVDRGAKFYILVKSDTTDVVREQRDRERTQTIHNSMMEQFASFLAESDKEKYAPLFTMENLPDRTAKGLGPATMVCYCRRASGRQCFVKFSGSASRNPVTGAVDAFGIETEYNSEMVTEVMNGKILARQYDMVTYIVGGYYGVTTGDAANITGDSIFPKEQDGVYMDYIGEQVIPVVPEEDRDATLTALSLDTIAKRLETEEAG